MEWLWTHSAIGISALLRYSEFDKIVSEIYNTTRNNTLVGTSKVATHQSSKIAYTRRRHGWYSSIGIELLHKGHLIAFLLVHVLFLQPNYATRQTLMDI